MHYLQCLRKASVPCKAKWTPGRAVVAADQQVVSRRWSQGWNQNRACSCRCRKDSSIAEGYEEGCDDVTAEDYEAATEFLLATSDSPAAEAVRVKVAQAGDRAPGEGAVGQSAPSAAPEGPLQPVPQISLTPVDAREGPAAKEPSGFVKHLFRKLHAAWAIFFPQQSLTGARDKAAKRLKVVLIADRVGLTPSSIDSMTQALVTALSTYVEIPDHGKDVQVELTEEVGSNGAVYSVSVPVRRIKTEVLPSLAVGGQRPTLLDADGVSVEWDEGDWTSDPSSRFPCGV